MISRQYEGIYWFFSRYDKTLNYILRHLRAVFDSGLTMSLKWENHWIMVATSQKCVNKVGKCSIAYCASDLACLRTVLSLDNSAQSLFQIKEREYGN